MAPVARRAQRGRTPTAFATDRAMSPSGADETGVTERGALTREGARTLSELASRVGPDQLAGLQEQIAGLQEYVGLMQTAAAGDPDAVRAFGDRVLLESSSS